MLINIPLSLSVDYQSQICTPCIRFFFCKLYRKNHAPDKQRYRFIGCDFFLQFRGFPVRYRRVFFSFRLARYVIGKRSNLLARGLYEQIICASPTTGVSPCCRCTCHNKVLEYPPDSLANFLVAFYKKIKTKTIFLVISHFLLKIINGVHLRMIVQAK